MNRKFALSLAALVAVFSLNVSNAFADHNGNNPPANGNQCQGNSCKGDKGPKGDTGPTGPQGPQGDPGSVKNTNTNTNKNENTAVGIGLGYGEGGDATIKNNKFEGGDATVKNSGNSFNVNAPTASIEKGAVKNDVDVDTKIKNDVDSHDKTYNTSKSYSDADANVKNSGNSSSTSGVQIGNFGGGYGEGQEGASGDVLSPEQSQVQAQSQGQDNDVNIDNHETTKYDFPVMPAAPQAPGFCGIGGASAQWEKFGTSLGQTESDVCRYSVAQANHLANATFLMNRSNLSEALIRDLAKQAGGVSVAQKGKVQEKVVAAVQQAAIDALKARVAEDRTAADVEVKLAAANAAAIDEILAASNTKAKRIVTSATSWLPFPLSLIVPR